MNSRNILFFSCILMMIDKFYQISPGSINFVQICYFAFFLFSAEGVVTLFSAVVTYFLYILFTYVMFLRYIDSSFLIALFPFLLSEQFAERMIKRRFYYWFSSQGFISVNVLEIKIFPWSFSINTKCYFNSTIAVGLRYFFFFSNNIYFVHFLWLLK